MKKILFLIASLIILVACGGKKQEQMPNDTEIKKYYNDTTIKKYYYKNYIEKLEMLTDIEIYIPKLNRYLNDTILKYALNDEFNFYYNELSCAMTSEGMDSDFWKRIIDIYHREPCYTFITTYYGKPIWIGQDFVSYSVWDSSYGEGAAHGMEHIRHYVFDIKTGRRLTVTEIFDVAKMLEFSSIISDTLYERYKNEDYPPISYYGADGFHLENVSFTENVVTVTYNPYEVACYAEGVINVDFSMEDVLPYMNKKSVIYRTVTK